MTRPLLRRRDFTSGAALAMLLPAARAAECPALLQHTMPRLQDEAPQPLCQYAGKVLLMVNTASQCGFTPQYEGLEKLHARYQRVSKVILLAEFPRSAAGKTLKRELRAPYWDAKGRAI